ncbi:MAG: hypothetical protein WD942_02470 [Dehalococcoidia bacterium]
MTIATWHPPGQNPPSLNHRGEQSAAFLYAAAGRALSEWEQTESALMEVFQVLCETSSLAATHAFSTIGTAQGRRAALAAAAEEFFRRRRATSGTNVEAQEKAVGALLKAYETASTCRSNIAHGVAEQPNGHGYFLCAQPIVGKKRPKSAVPAQTWPSGTAYFYKVSDIEECARRFVAIREQAMRLVIALSVARRVHRPPRVQLWGAGGDHERHG